MAFMAAVTSRVAAGERSVGVARGAGWRGLGSLMLLVVLGMEKGRGERRHWDWHWALTCGCRIARAGSCTTMALRGRAVMACAELRDLFFCTPLCGGLFCREFAGSAGDALSLRKGCG